MKHPQMVFLASLAACAITAVPLKAPAAEITAFQDGKALPTSDMVLARCKDRIVLKATATGKGTLRWFNLVPLQKTYQIALSPRLEERRPIRVEYRLQEITEARGRPELSLNGDDGLLALGTSYYFALEGDPGGLPQSGEVLSFSGLPKGPGGVSAIQLVVRKDDSYLGYLTELMNVPFGLAPLPAGGKNQTDLRVLTDCAEFALYGKRRQGRRFGYVGPAKIADYLVPVHEGLLEPRKVDGRWVYCGQGGRVPFSLGAHGIKPGDILYFGDQVAVFYGEKGTPDVLNPEDLMFYSFNQPPRILPIGQTEFKDRPLKVYRWNEFEK